MIKHEGDKYVVYSETGKRFGSYNTAKEANQRLRQMEMFKHMKKNAEVTFTVTDKWFKPLYDKVEKSQYRGEYVGGDNSPDVVFEGLGLKKFTGKFLDINTKKGPVNVGSFRDGELMRPKSVYDENMAKNPKRAKKELDKLNPFPKSAQVYKGIRNVPTSQAIELLAKEWRNRVIPGIKKEVKWPIEKTAGLGEWWKEKVAPQFEHAWYLTKHKYNVLGPGLQLGVGPWSLLKHDYTKFSPGRFNIYSQWLFGPKGRNASNPNEALRKKFHSAANAHVAAEAHHKYRLGLTMSIDEELEALSDWYSVAKSNGTTMLSFEDWFKANEERIKPTLSPAAFAEAKKRILEGKQWWNIF